jgi:hypothetical protein
MLNKSNPYDMQFTHLSDPNRDYNVGLLARMIVGLLSG